MPNDTNTWLAVAAIIVALVIYLGTELSNRKRLRSEQLLVAIEHIYRAESILYSHIRGYEFGASRSRNPQDFWKTINGAKNLGMQELGPSRVSMVLANKILKVHKEKTLSDQVDLLEETLNDLTEIAVQLDDESIEWSIKRVEIKRIHDKLSSNQSFLEDAVMRANF